MNQWKTFNVNFYFKFSKVAFLWSKSGEKLPLVLFYLLNPLRLSIYLKTELFLNS